MVAPAAQARGQGALIDPELFKSAVFRLGITGADAPADRARAALMIALPIYLQMVLEYKAMEAGLSIAPLSLSMFAIALLAGQAGRAPSRERDHPHRLRARHRGRRRC